MLFLTNNYVLANELVDKMNIDIANISMLAQNFEKQGLKYDIIKMNNSNFINKTSIHLPNNIKEALKTYTFTNLENMVLSTYFRTEYKISDNEIMNSGLVKEKVNVSNKDFYLFYEDFVKDKQDKIFYTLNRKEKDECLSENAIDGYVKISNNKFLTWY